MGFTLGQFPQKSQGVVNVLEIDAASSIGVNDNIKQLIGSLRFTKIFTRWFNMVAASLEENLNVKLFEPVLLTNAPVKMYTSATFRTNLENVEFVNVTGSGRTVTVWINPLNGTQDNAHVVLWQKSIPANTSLAPSELIGMAMENNEELWMECDQSNAVTCRASGSKERLTVQA